MNEKKNFFENFSLFMNQNIRGIQYGIYSIAGLGLIIALRSVRPFAKFSLPADIPSHFIRQKMPFIAKVNLVEPGHSVGMNPLLLVDHKPLVELSRKKTKDLPIEVSSVSVSGNGFIWLQSVLTNKNITFVPLKISQDKVFSIVLYKKQNVGEHLVKIGFATVSPIDLSLENDKYYLKYYKNLLSAERTAERKGAGIWAHRKITLPKLLLNKFRNLLPF